MCEITPSCLTHNPTSDMAHFNTDSESQTTEHRVCTLLSVDIPLMRRALEGVHGVYTEAKHSGKHLVCPNNRCKNAVQSEFAVTPCTKTSELRVSCLVCGNVHTRKKTPAVRTAVYISKDPCYKCDRCGNGDAAAFLHDTQQGDIVCTSCGAVVVQKCVFAGDAARHFDDDEEDTRTYGPVITGMFSSSSELRTTVAGTNKDAALLRSVSRRVESGWNRGNLWKDTRDSYKDDQRVRVYENIEQVGEALYISGAAQEIAKQAFNLYRQRRQKIPNAAAVVAACIVLGMRVVCMPDSTEWISGRAEAVLVCKRMRSGSERVDTPDTGARSGPMKQATSTPTPVGGTAKCGWCGYPWVAPSVADTHTCDAMPVDVKAQRERTLSTRRRTLSPVTKRARTAKKQGDIFL